jgi:hypothetical protein
MKSRMRAVDAPNMRYMERGGLAIRVNMIQYEQKPCYCEGHTTSMKSSARGILRSEDGAGFTAIEN